MHQTLRYTNVSPLSTRDQTTAVYCQVYNSQLNDKISLNDDLMRKLQLSVSLSYYLVVVSCLSVMNYES